MITSRAICFGLILGIALPACRRADDGGVVTLQRVEEFRSDPQALARFQSEHGNLGNHIGPLLVGQASLFLGRPFADVEQVFLREYQHRDVTAGSSVGIPAGWHALMVADPTSPIGYAPFPDVTLRNDSGARTAVILEALGPRGQSLGFSYVELEAGSSYIYKHNVVPLIILIGGITAKELGIGAAVVVVVGGAAAGGAKVADFIEDAAAALRTCKLLTPNIGRAYCKGGCGSGSPLVCNVTGKKSYWYFGEQAATCGCS